MKRIEKSHPMMFPGGYKLTNSMHHAPVALSPVQPGHHVHADAGDLRVNHDTCIWHTCTLQQPSMAGPLKLPRLPVRSHLGISGLLLIGEYFCNKQFHDSYLSFMMFHALS